MSTFSIPTLPWHRAPAARRVVPTRAAASHDVPALAPGEHILLRFQAGPGVAVVGTDRAVHVADTGGWRTIGWPDVDAAGWDPGASESVLRLWSDGTNAPVVRIPCNRRMALFILERVAATQVLRRRVRVSQSAVAVVVALRRPGTDSVRWRVQVDGPDDGGSESAHEAAGRVLAEIRELAGC